LLTLGAYEGMAPPHPFVGSTETETEWCRSLPNYALKDLAIIDSIMWEYRMLLHARCQHSSALLLLLFVFSCRCEQTRPDKQR
jgi:hypothetical protein